MIGKNNQYLKRTKEGTKVETYAIKKFKVGTASVVIGASIFFGAGAVAQASEDVSKNTIIDNSKNEGVTVDSPVSEKIEVKSVVKEATKEEVAAGVATKLGVKETEQESAKETVKTLDKTQLSNFIGEIEGKISSGAYVNKTEESIANLIVDLNSAKATLESATTQDELTKAYQKLVVSVNSKLRNKPVEKKETPVVESTTPKETVGNKAENTEKKVETNSIENMSTKDSRNGKEIAKNTAFRAAVNQDPKVDFTFSIPSEKKIYIYNEEHFSLEIPVYSESGKIRFATIKQGSRQRFANVAGTENDLDIQYGFTATVINRAETVGVTTNASQANPAKIVITGRPNDALKKHRDYTKQETQTLNVGTRYVQVVDDQGRENLKKGIDITDPGYFYLVLKAQSKKYALRSQPTDEKISVSSLTNPTAEDLQKIKDSIQLEYSTTNEDARFADKRGTLVEHPEDVIQSVGIVGNNIVVTFTDGSTKTKPVSEIIQKNILPVVNLPYSNETNRNIYIYSGEETDLTFTATDESKIKDMKLRGPGDVNYNNATNYGLTLGNVVDGAVASGEGSVSEDKKTATIKMTGTTNLRDGQKWTSVIVAKDDNNGESAPFNGRINATTNPAERQKIAGYAEFVVKNQTKKYDIKAPEGTVSVIDPANVTAEEFEKIKEKVKIEYSQTNDDANFIGKRGQVVDNQATRISTITKDASGNLVVTYKDGSTDTKPLSEYVSLNKQPAIDAINTAADNKIAEINSNTNATAEEKSAAIEKVNADKTKALTAINDNSVTTKSALDNAKTSGTTAISNDNPVATKKDTAKSAIDTALREKKAAIDANNALTTEEKNAAKADAQAKATATKTAIDNATTNSAVDSAKTAGTTSVDSVNPTAQAKPAAKKAIDEVLKAKEAQLDARADLTDEEKTAAKADAQARATAAKAAIDNATTNATVESAKTSGVADVESVNPQASQKKTDAKNAVDEALKAKNDAIDANNDLTDEEKTAAKADAKAKADVAKTAIDNARTNDAVEKAKNDGATSVDSVNPTAQAKPAAKKAIDGALKAKNDAIDANNDLTAEEKAKAKEDAKAKADAAKTAIDNAITNDAVTQAKNDGATSVDSVNPTPEAKPVAKKAVEDALAEKIKAIEANNALTDEEKATAKQEAQDKATIAKEAIDNARTNDEVTQAKTNGTTEVNNVDPQPEAKTEAKKAVEDALAEKIKAIEANNDLTDEEKATAKQEAQDKATAAKTAIDNAITNAAVEQTKTDGATSVDSVNPTAQAKPAAKKAIDEALKAKNEAIDVNNDLTAEEKAAAKADAKAKADAAKTAIDNATTNDAVTQAKENGTTEVNNVDPQPEAKTAAKKAVEDALAEKIKAIEANNALTDEEKATAKQEAQDKVTAAKEAIDNARTNDAVTQAKTDGTTEVNNVDPQPEAKTAAKKAVEDALAEKVKEIEANNALTDEEKATAKKEAEAKATEAKNNIDAARTNDAVTQAKTDGTTEVTNVDPQPEAKTAAKKAVEDALAEKIKEIEANNALTDEEKATAKQEAQDKATAAKTAIDNARTNDAVTQTKTDGTTEVNNVNPQPEAKTAAKKAVEDALVEKIKEIEANNDLTDEEKATAKQDAQDKATAAKEAINNATTNDAVIQAKTDGATSVDSVNPTAQAKPEAKKAIDDALKAKNDAIEANNDLTAEEKAKAKQAAQDKATAAKQAIDNVTTNDAVTQAKTDGATSVDSVNPIAQAKPAAKKAIDDALKAKNDAIDARTDLTDEEKIAAKADAKAKADAAKTAIDNATTNDAVTQAKTDGTTEVTNVDPQPEAKTAAKKAVEDALAEKIKEIEVNNDLTDEEKATAKQDAEAKATEAKNNIDAARTNDAVTQAKTDGTTEVTNVDPQPEAKTAAKKAVEDALAEKIKEIEANNALTDEEKATAKQEAQDKVTAAKTAIDNARTNDAVTQAKENGTTEVNNVDPQPEAKTAAKKAVEDALAEKIKEIEANNDLTDEEKATAKQEAQDKVTAAKQAIDNATTNVGVEQAKTDGTTKVNNVNPQPEVKTAAKKAVEDALAEKIKEIEANNALTDEEKATAKQEAQDKATAAKTAIDNATTNAGVEQAKENGTTEVTNVDPQPEAKTVAKKAVEDALAEKIKEIEANNALTDEEKATAKQDTEAKATAAKTAIDNARTNAAVTQAKTDGTTEVNNVNPQPEAKTAAKKAVEDALAEKIKEIEANNALTDEEKATAKQDAEAKATAAKTAIDNATTNAGVEQAKENGTTEVTNVDPQPEAKTVAKKAVEDALAEKIKEIEANNALTDEEKATAKQDTEAKATAAKTAIDNARTNAAVTQAKTDGTIEVNNVNPQPEAKTAAKKAIDDALKAKNDAIDANNDLTDEEKTAAKVDAKAKADAAKTAIDNARTNDAVTQAKENGTTEVTNVDPQPEAKTAAKKAIDDALKAKNDAIDARTDLTDEEKTAAKADAKAKADTAKTAIDNATTNAGVEQAKTDGTTEVNNVNQQPEAKTAAKKAVEDALAEKIKEIEANNDLTDEEKATAKQDAEAKATEAKNNIDAARTNDAVTQAKTDGTTEVTNVDPQPEAKTAAKKAVEDALAEKIKAIEANSDLTDEEKTAAKQDAQAKADAAKTAIDNATTNDAVTQAKNDGTTSVDSVDPQPEAKTAAKKAVEDALAEKIKEIEANNALTDEEKATAKQEAQDKATAAKEAIDNVTTNVGVEQAKTNGTTEVTNVDPQPEAKTAAKKAIDDALKAKNDAIEANNALTDEEKVAARKEAEAKATEAKNNIDAARTNDAVTQAKTDGTTEVNNVNPQPEAKTAAKKAVEDALDEKIKEIEANNALTDEEKATAKQDAQAKADAAKQAIDNATTNDAVTQAKTDGATNVDSVNPTAQAKPTAKKAIDDALKAKNDEIDARTDLTDEEKTAAKADAKAKADAAKTAIDNARTNDAVTQAKTDGTTEVNNVDPQPEAKTAAKKAVEDALAEKIKAIEANNALTDEEKATAKQDAESKATAAKTAIDNARTNDAVTQAKTDGTTEVNNVDPQPEAKTAAKKAVEDALAEKIKEIEANNALTDEEKATAKQDAEAKATAAKIVIDNATTNAGVEQAKENGTTEVNNVNPQPEAKTAAKKAVEDALAEKIKEIETNNDLTDEEKAAAKKDAEAKATEAKNNIDAARTNDAVTQAKENGTTEVTNVNPQPEAKTAAKKAIDDALEAKEAAIDANNDLTDEEKTAAKADAKAKADAAKTAIDNARTNDAVTQAKTDGTTEVNNVDPQPEAKTAAKKAVEDALAEKIKEIDANNALTDEEKATAKQEAQAKADEAKEAINNARTNDAVTQAKENGTTEVTNVNPQPEAKTAAKKAIDDALEAKEAAIDANNDLTDEEKTAAKADAKAKADAAKTAIDNARTNDAVTQAKTDGTTEVNNVDPQPEAKTAAKKAVEDALAEKIKEIDANNALTDEEKATAKQEAQAKADEAKEAINNARTNDAVTQAKENGTTEVNNVDPQPEAKTVAKKAVEDALAEKIKEIEANNALTDEEKATAKKDAEAKSTEAKNNIDAARTNAEVETAKTNGTTEVNNVDPQPEAKTAAKKAVEDALAEKIKVIEANSALTDEEKATAKQDAESKATEAKNNIDAATTNDAVTQAKENGTTEVNNVDPQPEAKTAAKKAVEDTLAEKIKEIEANNDLTNEEKATAKQDAESKATEAKNNIDAARTNDAVTQAKTDGTTEVNNVDPQPEAKTAAKKAIDDALKAKNDAIDANNDLTDEEKTAAKVDAKAKADAAKTAIDNARTNDAVTQAKENGTTEVTNVDPQPEAKTAAKKAVEDALAEKVKEIEANNALTDEEKATAKKEAEAKATEAKNNIDAARTNDAVTQAKENGTTEVNNVDPQPEAKTVAKKAVEDALAEKIKEIEANNALTDEEKTAAKADAKAKADAVKTAIDNARTNDAVTQAKTDGTTEVNNVDPQPEAKTAAKKAVEDALDEKIKEIEANNALTDEEKAAAKADAKAKADAAKEAINNARTNDAVIQAKTDGKTEVNNVDPQPEAKTAAKKAVEDKLAEQLKAIENTPDATDEEKKVAADKAKALAEETKRAIDNAQTDADVKKLQKESETKIEKTLPLVEDKPNARKAIDEAAKAKKQSIDARTDLSEKAKELLKVQVDKIAEQAKTDINKATKLAELGKIEESQKETIKAVGEVNIPAKKVIVKDSTNVTEAEKEVVKKAIEAINPGATVEVDDKGNATVTLKGNTVTIEKEQLVKTEAEAKAKNGGDNINLNFDKVLVSDLNSISKEEKVKFQYMILGAITEVEEFDISSLNIEIDETGNAKVTSKDGKVELTVKIDENGNSVIISKDGKIKLAVNFDEKGNATVVTQTGQILAIPAEMIFKEKEKVVVTPEIQTDVNVPAAKVLVADKENLTQGELAKIKESVEAVNPGATAVVDEKGNVTVTTKDGQSVAISADQLVKTGVDAAGNNNGNNINLNFEKQEVADPNNLTDTDKTAAKAKIIATNPNAVDVIFDAKGNATVVLKDGKAYTILAKDIFSKKGESASSRRDNGAGNTNGGADVDASNSASDPNGKNISSKLGQRLANTGTTETNTGLAGLGLGILGTLLAATRRRKEKNED